MDGEATHPWPRILLLVIVFAALGILVTTQSGVFEAADDVAPTSSASGQ